MTITTTFLGRALLLLPPDLDSESVGREQVVDMEQFVGDSGTMVQKTHAALPNFKTTATFLCETRAQWDELETFLRSRAGRCYSFWLPSWHDDITVLSAGFFDIVIPYIGYTDNLFPYFPYRKFVIVDRTNPLNVWPRFIDSSVDNGDGTETLTGVVGFPYPLDFANATSVNYRFMIPFLVRLDTDDWEIEYLSGEMVQTTIPVFHVADEGM